MQILCTFGPAIILGISKAWWVGVIAFVVQGIFNWFFLICVTPKLPERWMPPVVRVGPYARALVVLIAGWRIF